MVDIRIPLKEDIAIAHKDSIQLLFDMDRTQIQFRILYFLGVKLSNAGLSILIDKDYHIICGLNINNFGCCVELVEGIFIVAVEFVGLFGQDEYIIITCGAFDDVFIEWYFLWYGIGLLMVMSE